MWNISLKEPIGLDSGQELKTLEDVRSLMNSLPGDLKQHKEWQLLDRLLTHAAASGDSERAEIVSQLVMNTLQSPPFTDGDGKPIRAQPKGKRWERRKRKR